MEYELGRTSKYEIDKCDSYPKIDLILRVNNKYIFWAPSKYDTCQKNTRWKTAVVRVAQSTSMQERNAYMRTRTVDTKYMIASAVSE